MRKTRGKKKKANASPKKAKESFFMHNRVSIIALVVSVLCLALLLVSNLNSTGDSITGNTLSISDNPPQIILTLSNFLNLGSTWRELIISLVVLLIIFSVLFDLIEVTSIFSNPWVMYVIAGGLAVIACLTSIVYNITTFALQLLAGFGALGVVIEIAVAIIMGVGLAVGNSKIAIWVAKSKAQKEEIKAIKGAGAAGGAITALKKKKKRFKSP